MVDIFSILKAIGVKMSKINSFVWGAIIAFYLFPPKPIGSKETKMLFMENGNDLKTLCADCFVYFVYLQLKSITFKTNQTKSVERKEFEMVKMDILSGSFADLDHTRKTAIFAGIEFWEHLANKLSH